MWDHDRRNPIIATKNNMLKTFNMHPNVFFIPTFRPFFNHNSELKKKLFCYDSLHLTQAGSVVLRTYFREKIDKANKGFLK